MKKLMFLLIILPLFLSAQNKGDTIVSKQDFRLIKERIEKLESSNDSINSSIRNSSEYYNIAKEYSNTADNLVKIFIPIISILLTLINILIFVNLKEFINARLATIMDQKEEMISDIFLKHEIEKGLLKESKILIINKGDTNINEYLKKILEKFSKKMYIENIEDFVTHKYKHQFQEFDLVLFDNTNTKENTKNWDFNKDNTCKTKLVEIAREVCKKNVPFFFFGRNDGGFSSEIPEYNHLINFSNSPSTAYSNIIILLNFSYLLKKS